MKEKEEVEEEEGREEKGWEWLLFVQSILCAAFPWCLEGVVTALKTGRDLLLGI